MSKSLSEDPRLYARLPDTAGLATKTDQLHHELEEENQRGEERRDRGEVKKEEEGKEEKRGKREKKRQKERQRERLREIERGLRKEGGGEGEHSLHNCVT